MTKETGETIAWADFDAWGKPRSPRGHDMNMAGVDNAVSFTSYTYDVVLDLYFAQARFYDANSRRFISVDPIKDGINWYAYCEGNPITFVDPSGLDSYVIWASYGDSKDTTDNERQAKIRAATYERMYRTPSHVIEVKSAADFEEAWNGMGLVGRNEVSIDVVEVISHGHYINHNDEKIGVLLFAQSTFHAKDSDGMGRNDRSINDLLQKEMRGLNFSACNTANQDFDINIATAFYENNPDIQTVTGWDGGVGFVFSSRNPFFKASADYPSLTQTTFYNLRQESDTREPGKITMSRWPRPSTLSITLPRHR